MKQLVSPLNLKLTFFALIAIAVVFEVAADITFKQWSLNNRSVLLGAGVFLYLLATVVWAVSLRYEFLSKAVPVFAIINLIVITIAGAVLFKENISWINKLGVLIGIISILLIEL